MKAIAGCTARERASFSELLPKGEGSEARNRWQGKGGKGAQWENDSKGTQP